MNWVMYFIQPRIMRWVWLYVAAISLVFDAWGPALLLLAFYVDEGIKVNGVHYDKYHVAKPLKVK